MGSSFLTQWLSDHEMKAICWTLIHSLWIGLIIAALAGLVISITRKSGADLRYRLLCGILVLFILSVSVTFYLQIRSVGHGAIHTGQGIYVVGYAQPHAMPSAGTGATVSPVNKAVDFLNQHIDVIFVVWLLFFILKSLKMAGGLLYIQRIRNYKVHPVTEEFKHKIEMFARQIGIRQKIRLVQSELVKVPAAVGWLKPVILLPMGIILQLPAEQLESILWHELAHIYRRDYLVNILQGLVETVFFFNPGLLWLSSLIRAEREACCDDMVLSRMNRKANYLEALLAFGFEDSRQMNLLMSIGSGDDLRNRLKRMVSQENKRLSMAEKVVLAIGLVLLSAFTIVPKKTNEAVNHMINIIGKKTNAAIPVIARKVAPVKEERPHHQQQVVNDTVVKKIDAGSHFVSILFKESDADLANNDISAMDNKGNKYHFVVADSRLVAMEFNGAKIENDKLESYQYMISRIYSEIDQKRRVSWEDVANSKANSPFVKYDMDSKRNHYIQPDDANEGDQVFYKQNFSVPPPWATPTPTPTPTFGRYLKKGVILKRTRDDSLNYATALAKVRNIIADLVKEEIVPDAASVKSFGLTDMELVVNDQKQSDAVHEKFNAKYGVRENNGIYYGPVKMTGRGTFIDNDEQRAQRLNFKVTPFKNKMLLDAKSFPRFKTRPGPGLVVSDIIADLVSEKVVKDKSDLASFNLTNSVLIVNGVKQADALHDRLKDKYLTGKKYDWISFDSDNDNPNFGFHFDRNKGSMGYGISKDKNDN
jgi:bla regulator protein BlaR1